MELDSAFILFTITESQTLPVLTASFFFFLMLFSQVSSMKWANQTLILREERRRELFKELEKCQTEIIFYITWKIKNL